MDIQPALNKYATAVRAALARIVANKNVIGKDGARGTIYRNIFSGFVVSVTNQAVTGDFPVPPVMADDGDVYLHFKLPVNTLRDSKMFWLKVMGYNYGAAKAIDITAVGYSYQPTNALMNTNVIATHPTEYYRDTNGNIVLCIKFASIYYTSLEIDSMMVGNGSPIRRGDLKVQFSKSDRVVF